MPIGFARLEFVKRSSGKNACAKAAYNSRGRIEFLGNEFHPQKIYDWSKSTPPVFHDILLPDHVDQKFKSPECLWNSAEQKDTRKNSQPAFEMVLALPDDQVISLEDRKRLAKTFVIEHFVKNGLAAQIDIHPPDQKTALTEEGEIAHTKDHNWHAHVLTTTRRFKENGQELSDHKARDMMPNIRNGKVISGPNWGKLWTQHQNTYFEQKGLSLRVEEQGIVPQKHLGPVRMRGRAFALLDDNTIRIELNKLESKNPENILTKLTETKNIFTPEEVDNFLQKHVESNAIPSVKEAFWKLPTLTQLLNPTTQKPLNKFTTQSIIEEEKQAIRLADKLVNKTAFPTNSKKTTSFTKNLNQEQKEAFHNILNGQKLSCIEGFAGTGKSHLLNALSQAYQKHHYQVRALGPDTATASALKEVGFTSSENIYQFLFAVKNSKRQIAKNQEIWIVDEAGKLGTPPLLELLKYANKYNAQLIISGDSKQLPAVSRGGMFPIFSEKYGSQNLQHIQRQEKETQRQIAKNLAIGQMGTAIDAIVKEGDVKWHSTKEKALEALITDWAYNRLSNPYQTNLILAHTNKEVKALNELARLYRQQAGELSTKEYACETFQGKIYVSSGDLIEFRQKNQDLGITNGLTGTLTKASPNKFTVQITGEKRTISFNPQKFTAFQLGYATTYYRAQGRTVDKAFVLHSPMMNKELFYVGLTRHVKQAELYISEQDTKTLSDVKAGAFRSSVKESTINYLTHNEIENKTLEKTQTEKLNDLKTSDSILSKAKGYGLLTWINVRTKVSKAIENHQDKKPDQTFFNPDLSQKTPAGTVVEVLDEKIPVDKEAVKANYQHILNNEPPQPFPKPQPKERFSKLPQEQKNLIDSYFKSVDTAASFYTIVKAEGTPLHRKEWQQSCGERNSLAFEVISNLSEQDTKKIFKGKSFDILHDRAAKHQALQERSQINYDEKLKDNLDALLHRLYPEGPTAKDRDGLRFGVKGSLKVVCSGSKRGSFFDFENHQGGGPLQLIQKELICSKSEAFSWARDFVGEAHNIEVPTHYNTKRFTSKTSEWLSVKPDPKIPAPNLNQLSPRLASSFKETMRHTYRDEEGNVLFHTLRLEHKNGINRKMVLPLSYGYNPESDQKPKWELKGYQAPQNPIYNLHLLDQYPHAKVLIVEGEKTADVALNLYPKEKMISISWIGGAGAVGRTDWSPLKGREVIIWPDNDKAGFEASDTLCRNLQQTGLKSLSEVNREHLAIDLPPKWDLADTLPEDKDQYFINRTLLRAEKKGLEASHQNPKDQEQNLEKLPNQVSRGEMDISL